MIPGTPTQPDLFVDSDLTEVVDLRRQAARPSAAVRTRQGPHTFDHEASAQLLEASGDYRVLRRLKPREVDTAYRPRPDEAVAIVVDVETTGLDHRCDEVIEIGMVAFVYDAAGRVGPVIGALSLLREPSIEISPDITRLTGITSEMVAGCRLDLDAVTALLEPADLLIAHNARFDRNFCERLHDGFRHKAWACSVDEVKWGELGYEGSKLGYLVTQGGWFHRGHRAVDDCHALLEVLAAPLPDESGSALSHLLSSSRRTRVRIWAEYAPFDQKDVLRRRGYRWNGGEDGRPKAWWTEIDEEHLAAELRFLEREIYLRNVELRQEVITAYERYRAA
ncbi:MAG: 3'-5' exonuclease [Janthinobacterium lividum]